MCHVCPQVWISFAQFELSAGREERLPRCRQIYEEANKAMRSCEEKEERVMLLESWRSFEDEFGTDATKERIDKLMPEKIKKRRKLQAEDGVRKNCASSGCEPLAAALCFKESAAGDGITNLGLNFLLFL